MTRVFRPWLISAAFVALEGCLCGGAPSTDDASVTDGGEPSVDAGPPPMVRSTGCWSAPLVLPPAAEVWAPRLASLPTGEALVMWSSFDGRLSAQRFSPDGGRGQRLDLVDAGPAALEGLVFSANQQGDALGLWLSSSDGGADKRLFSSRLGQNGWGSVELIDDGPAIAARSAVTTSGEVIITWVVPFTATGFPSLRARHSRGASWLAPETLSPFGWQFGSVELTAGAVAVASWTQWGPPTFEPVATSSIWTAGTRRDRVVKNNRVTDTSGIDTLASSSDRAVSSLATSSTEFELHRLVDDAWHPGPRVLRTDEAIPVAGVDGEGQLTVWSTTTSAAGTTLVATTETDGGWRAAREVSTQREPIRFITSATNASGSALVGWSRERTLVIERTEPDGGRLDFIDGLVVIPGRVQPQVAVSSSGTRWILGQAAEPEGRSVLLVCP